MKIKYTLSFLLALCCGFCTSRVAAQATSAKDYYFYASSGTYSYLSGGTDISAIEVDDGLTASISLGFTFTYCGVDYTNIYASSNGWISFGSSPYFSAYPGALGFLSTGSSTGIGPALMPLWDDLSGDGESASYTSTGSAPNRVFTIEFKNWLWDYSTSVPSLSFQVRLYEGTNVIEYIYKQESGTPDWFSSPGATIGIGGGTTTDFLSLDNTSPSPTPSSTILTNSLRSKPLSGQIYQFSPSPACSGTPTELEPTGTTTKVCSGTDFTLYENALDVTIGKTYQWQSRPAGSGPYSPIVGATSSTLTTNITANTDFQLVATCTGSGSSSTSATHTVNVLEKPAILTSGPTTFCSNQSFNMTTAPDPSYSYQWINTASGSISGATNNIYEPTSSGSYTLQVTTSGCTDGAFSADTINVVIKSAPTADINPSPEVTICIGDVTILNGTGAGDYQWLDATGIIPGATATTYTTNSGGDYNLVITNPSNGCADTSATTKVIASPAPTVYLNPADSFHVCTGLPATLTGMTTGLGLSYQWYNSAGSISGANTGILVTPDPENYFLVVRAGSCSDTSTITKLILWPLPAATISSIGTTSAVCPMNNDMVLQANNGTGYTYQWILDAAPIAGATSRNYTAATAGIYTVKVTDPNGCVQVSDTFRAKSTPAANPVITPTDLEFCDGNSVTLYATVDKYYIDYQWFKNSILLPADTSITYVVGSTGYYSLQIIDSFGCKTLSNEALATVYPTPAKPAITLFGTYLSTTFFSSYQWYRNGKEIPGATSRTYTPTFDGTYTVVVTNTSGCSNTSDEYILNPTAISEQKVQQLYLYPNPSESIVHIDYTEPVNIEVRDMQGKQVSKQNLTNQTDMSNWADGIYFYTITDKNNNILRVEKIAKKSN